MNKVIRDGKVAVLYSPGYGAGWYTWNSDYKQALYDPEIVALVESDERDKITDELMENLQYYNFYAGGAHTLEIMWIKEGARFYVTEYDGHENVLVEEDLLKA